MDFLDDFLQVQIENGDQSMIKGKRELKNMKLGQKCSTFKNKGRRMGTTVTTVSFSLRQWGNAMVMFQDWPAVPITGQL